MLCPGCQSNNQSGNAFCGHCGAPLAVSCAQCGAKNPPDNAFCGKCGERLGLDPGTATHPEPEVGERRQITVLFCDLVGSTDLSTRLDPEDYREAVRAYHTRADEVVARYGSTVAQHLGDGLLIYFGWPQTYDDAAERAVRAGLELVEVTATIHAGGAPLAARVGLHTGAVVVSDVGRGAHRETLALGDTPNVAARVQTAAQPGQVLITPATLRLVAGLFVVEELGAHPLKGVPQPLELYRVVQPSGVRGRLDAVAAHGFTPFVNRADERAILRSRFERVCDGEGQVLLLIGEAGIGKSRLAQVFRDDLAGTPHTWLEINGSARFANTPFYPVIELLHQRRPWDDESPRARVEGVARSLQLSGLDPREALPVIAPLLDLPLPEDYRPAVGAPEVVRKRLLATMVAWVFGTARLQPLVIAIEDLHWVDPSSLELLQILVEQGTAAPLLLLLTTRPQFRVPWLLRAHHTQIMLGHLSKRHVRDMVLGVAAQADLLADVIDAVAARTDGVPLFVEELTKAVMEAGTSAAAREIPSTLADSLMARLDRLGPRAKEVAQVGAVCGREFTFAMVQAVHGIAAAELEAALQKLVDAELLRVRGFGPEVTYTFKHALVQDAAYESLLKSRRRALHAQAATALTEHFPEIANEHPELVAYHHEGGGQIEPAVAGWQRAGERALPRGAAREAERYIARGLALLATLPEGPTRNALEFQLQLALGNAQLYARGYAAPQAAEAFSRAVTLGEELTDPAAFFILLTGMFMSALTRDGPAVGEGIGTRLFALAERSPILPAAAIGHFALGLVDMYLSDLAGARAHFHEALSGYQDDPHAPTFVDLRIGTWTHLADVAWQLGYADQARAYLRDAASAAAESPRPMDREWVAQHAATLFALFRDPIQATAYADIVAQTIPASPAHGAVLEVVRG